MTILGFMVLAMIDWPATVGGLVASVVLIVSWELGRWAIRRRRAACEHAKANEAAIRCPHGTKKWMACRACGEEFAKEPELSPQIKAIQQHYRSLWIGNKEKYDKAMADAWRTAGFEKAEMPRGGSAAVKPGDPWIVTKVEAIGDVTRQWFWTNTRESAKHRQTCADAACSGCA